MSKNTLNLENQAGIGQRVTQIASRDNALIKKIRRLTHDSTAYRRFQVYWIEGEHLCLAALSHRLMPQTAVFAQSVWDIEQAKWLAQLAKPVPVVIVPDALFDTLSTLESPSKVGFLMAMPVVESKAAANLSHNSYEFVDVHGVLSYFSLQTVVVLDRVQDPGNVGAILRSSAALGVRQVIALEGTCALWSGKVLRAGMGAHWALQMIENMPAQALCTYLKQRQIPLLTTSSHRGQWLHDTHLPSVAAWVFSHEGQGVQPILEDNASLQLKIIQPGGQESLNIVAAASICLYSHALVRHVLNKNSVQ